VWPRKDGDLSRFTGWLTLTHTQRWHAHRHTAGSGHLYQGRFKSFPVQTDGHFLILCRYVERNPLRAGLVDRAEEWRWSSLSRQADEGPGKDRPVLASWPVERTRNWLQVVNQPQTPQEEDAIRTSIARGRPFGRPVWQKRTARRLGLELTSGWLMYHASSAKGARHTAGCPNPSPRHQREYAPAQVFTRVRGVAFGF
jgi:putative transposase